MEDERLLHRIATDYYTHKLTQQEMADRYHIFRTKVFRLISEAQDRGIIEVIANYPASRHREAEGLLRARFGLKSIYVINSREMDILEAYDAACSAAADYINGVISNKAVFSISRGKTMYRLVQHLKPVQAYVGGNRAGGVHSRDRLPVRELDRFKLPCRVFTFFLCHSAASPKFWV